MPKGKIEVIYNGIEVPENVPTTDLRRRYDVPKNHFIFVAAGRIAKQKGYDVLIEALTLLKKRNIELTVLVAGKGRHKSNLENFANECGVSDMIQFIGFVDNPMPFLKSADAVVLPSRYEGMPNTALETMAVGNVILATRVNGVSELITDGVDGFITEQEDPVALAEDMLRVIESQDTFDSIRQNAVETIRNRFSIPRMIDHIEDYLYKKI
jgi:glycosyltransferase involved in cell wall biosynthesis